MNIPSGINNKRPPRPQEGNGRNHAEAQSMNDYDSFKKRDCYKCGDPIIWNGSENVNPDGSIHACPKKCNFCKTADVIYSGELGRFVNIGDRKIHDCPEYRKAKRLKVSLEIDSRLDSFFSLEVKQAG
jgi:hypothetical protein